jgi:FKBP-type peptidyl-prolyl cis-trans isomerase
MKILFTIVVFALLTTCSPKVEKQETKVDPYAGYNTFTSGMRYLDKNEGSGSPLINGQKVTVHYIVRLEDGSVQEDTYKMSKPFTFELGDESMLRGVNEGIAGMKKGGKRILVIPPELAYGSRSIKQIPANSTLIFELEILDIK